MHQIGGDTDAIGIFEVKQKINGATVTLLYLDTVQGAAWKQFNINLIANSVYQVTTSKKFLYIFLKDRSEDLHLILHY